MQLHTLKSKTPRKKSRQVGRGGKRGRLLVAALRVRTLSGTQKRPELRDFIKRFPKLRGRGVNSLKSIQSKLRGAELQAYLAEKKAKRASAEVK